MAEFIIGLGIIALSWLCYNQGRAIGFQEGEQQYDRVVIVSDVFGTTYTIPAEHLGYFNELNAQLAQEQDKTAQFYIAAKLVNEFAQYQGKPDSFYLRRNK